MQAAVSAAAPDARSGSAGIGARLCTCRSGWRRSVGLAFAAGLAALILSGCASGPDAHPQDPLEPMNRQVQHFNDAVDRSVARPLALAWRDSVPSPLRTGVSNFFNNLADFGSFVNASLQARPQEAVENFTRVKINTFFGFGGVLDIASEAGVPRTTLDFGLTLGRWGVPAGPYLVLPLLGPATLRDGLARVADPAADPLAEVQGRDDRTALSLLRMTNTRYKLLPATDMVDRMALDRYSFIRDAYLQLRQALVDEARGLEPNSGPDR